MRKLGAIGLLLVVANCKPRVTQTADAAVAVVEAGPAATPTPLVTTIRDKVEKAFRESSSLDEVPAKLPEKLLKSFVLKHGRLRTGERGHLVEKRVSQSADPDAPRAILFDDETGLTLSYNGGTRDQKQGQRLDVHAFDETTKRFELFGWNFADAGHIENSDCATCHGKRLRPIFSMYPDWPAFYGSDNDELNNPKVDVQGAELTDYRAFLAGAAKTSPRYKPLFANAPYETYPYRPDVRTDIHATSRSFAYRPGLRLGLLLNRLQARSLTASILEHPRYPTLGKLFFANLVRCKVGADLLGNREAVQKALGGEAPRLVEGSTLHARQAWRLFDLDIRDVDIRYSYGHDGYASEDARKAPMAVGYMGTYWNSYFDGSATIDELVGEALYEAQPALAGIITADSLKAKYEAFKERYALDAAFFEQMDTKGKWLPLPYPKELNQAHHRDGWPKEHRAQHAKLCEALGTTPLD